MGDMIGLPRHFKVFAIAAAAAAALSAPASAGCHLIDCVENVYLKNSEVRDFDCERLWVLRNSIFQDAGYCFKTPRAINWFGNAGCKYDSVSNVPLNSYQRHNVKVLQAAEQRRGCRS